MRMSNGLAHNAAVNIVTNSSLVTSQQTSTCQSLLKGHTASSNRENLQCRFSPSKGRGDVLGCTQLGMQLHPCTSERLLGCPHTAGQHSESSDKEEEVLPVCPASPLYTPEQEQRGSVPGHVHVWVLPLQSAQQAGCMHTLLALCACVHLPGCSGAEQRGQGSLPVVLFTPGNTVYVWDVSSYN